mgnify:CR=1 FL=1
MCVQEVVTPIYIMSYNIKWVTTSWTYGIEIGSLLLGHTVYGWKGSSYCIKLSSYFLESKTTVDFD